MVSGSRQLRLVAIVGLDAAAITLLRPEWSRLAALCRSPNSTVAAIGPDLAISEMTGGLLWCAAIWFGLGLVASLAALLPGAFGRAGTSLLHKAYPRVLSRLLVGATGVSIVLTPLSAGAQSFPTGAGHGPVSSTAVAAGWPSDTSSPQNWSTVQWPTDGLNTHEPAVQQGQTVAVHRGDSLWSISKRRLGATAKPADVSAEWPHLYAANRTTIGADPNLIQPGMSLQAPSEESR